MLRWPLHPHSVPSLVARRRRRGAPAKGVAARRACAAGATPPRTASAVTEVSVCSNGSATRRAVRGRRRVHKALAAASHPRRSAAAPRPVGPVASAAAPRERPRRRGRDKGHARRGPAVAWLAGALTTRPRRAIPPAVSAPARERRAYLRRVAPGADAQAAPRRAELLVYFRELRGGLRNPAVGGEARGAVSRLTATGLQQVHHDLQLRADVGSSLRRLLGEHCRMPVLRFVSEYCP